MVNKCRFLICLLLCTSILFTYSEKAEAVSYAKLYYYTQYLSNPLGPGTTSSIKSKLSSIGYSTTRYANFATIDVLNGMSVSNVFHILTHGGAGFFQTLGNNVDAAMIANNISSLTNLNFIFIEACNTGASYSFRQALTSMGVTCSVTFSQVITATGDSDGIHYFSNRVYKWACNNGYSITAAVSKAKAETVENQGGYYGSNYCIVTNNTYI